MVAHGKFAYSSFVVASLITVTSAKLEYDPEFRFTNMPGDVFVIAVELSVRLSLAPLVSWIILRRFQFPIGLYVSTFST